MENKKKFIIVGLALAFVAILAAVYFSFQNRQKELEAEKNEALLQSAQNNGGGTTNAAPTVQGTILSLVQLAIEKIRAGKKKADPNHSGEVSGKEVKSYLASTGVDTDNLGGIDPQALENTTWNGAETYGG